MNYPRKNVEAVNEDYERKRKRNEDSRLRRLTEIYSAFPEIKNIDMQLAETGRSLISAVSSHISDIGRFIEELKAKNLKLQKERADILSENGYSPDYTDLRYDCPKCHDTGYDGVYMCECMKKALIEKGFESSGIANLLKEQSFETFSLDYYTEAELSYMCDNYNDLRLFANHFENDKRNFLLIGATGLGKTHLSTSVAKVVVEKGFNVVYETAQNIFTDFSRDRFSSSDEPESQRYLDCDLLIIDDLGAEAITQFSVACLYNIINTRLNRNLPIIASTNLTKDELRKVYQDRITSRLFGNFYIKLFVGSDVRKKKI